MLFNNMKKNFIVVLLTFIFFLMLLFPAETKSSALSGLLLWSKTIVPTLFPFMIISGIITETGSYDLFCSLSRFITKYFFKLSYYSGYPLFIGLLCGFPMGSKIISDMVKAQRLTLAEGNILLTFCNNISPAFVISFICGYALNLDGKTSFCLSFAILFSPLLTGSFMSHILRHKQTDVDTDTYKMSAAPPHEFSFEKCLSHSIEAVLKLGGYIVFFSIICGLTSIFMKDKTIYAILSSFLEITTGVFNLSGLDTPFSIYLICLFSSFGGLCALFQTKSMISGSGLNIFYYVSGKILTAVISIILLMLLSLL